MKVALVRSPCVNLPYPPSIGIAYISAALKKAGHEVFIFDLNIEIFHAVSEDDKKIWNISDVSGLCDFGEKIFHKYGQLFKEYIKKILETEASVVGFSVWNTNVGLSLKLAKEIKQLNPEIKVIFGGPDCFPRWSGVSSAKNDYVDAVVYGEGEEAITEVIDYLQMTGRVGLHPGTIVRKNSSVVDCGSRKPAYDLDALPFPDFDGFPLEKYMTREMSILFNRGCPRKCAYCSLPGTTPAYRSRSARSIYEEIKYQIKKYSYIDSFHDDSPALNSNLKELSGLCELIIQDGLKIRWSGFASINKHMDVILLKKMKEAGCSGLNFGIESGSQKIVDKMRKGFRIEDAANNLRDAYNLGIETVANFIIGFPGEEEEDFQQTLDFISSNKQYISYVGSSAFCWIGPYIWLYEHSEEFGIIPDQNFSGWSCKEVNDQIRNERGLRFKKLLDSLEIGKSYPQLSEKK